MRAPTLILVLIGAAVAHPAQGAESAMDVSGQNPALILTLRDVEQRVAENRDVLIAAQGVESAAAAVAQADARPNPVLSWNQVSISPHDGIGSGPIYGKRSDQTLRIDQTFERGDKRALRVAAASTQFEAAKADLQDQRRASLQAIRAAYFDLMLAEARAGVFDESHVSSVNALNAAERRLRAGDLARADVARVRVSMLQAEADLGQANSEVLIARHAMALILGLSPSLAIATDGHWPESTGDVEGSRAIAASRPDVVSARLNAQAAGTAVEVARAQGTRDVTVGVQIERYPGPLGAGNTFGFGISIPLFWGNDFRGDIARARSEQALADRRAEKVEAEADASIAKADIDVSSARERVHRYDQAIVRTAEDAMRAAEFAFERGAIGVMDLMDARRTLLTVRLDALSAHADMAKALAVRESVTTLYRSGMP